MNGEGGRKNRGIGGEMENRENGVGGGYRVYSNKIWSVWIRGGSAL